MLKAVMTCVLGLGLIGSTVVFSAADASQVDSQYVQAAENVNSSKVAKPTCCAKRAYCCKIERPCCR